VSGAPPPAVPGLSGAPPPAVPGVSGAPPPAVPGVRHDYVDAAGLRVHVARAGQAGAAPLLLLHGWPQHWWCWRHVIERLGDRFDIVAPDLRGFGWTQAPGHGYDPPTFARDAVALLDALEIHRCVVAGHDWGGFTTFLLALGHPERFERAVVCNVPPPWTKPSARAVTQLWRTWYALAVAAPGSAAVLSRPRLMASFMRLGGKAAVFSDGEAGVYLERLADPARAKASQALYRAYLAFFAARVRPGPPVRALTVPTTLLWGEDEAYIPSAYLDSVHRAGDALTLARIPGCGHFTPEERPDLVAAAIAGAGSLARD
jgi:pimeloyl-ACP methyl ester carboxylesterase